MSLDLVTQKKYFQFGIPKIEYIPLEYEDVVLAPLYGKDVQVHELFDGSVATYYSVYNPTLHRRTVSAALSRAANAVLRQFSLGVEPYCEGVCSRSHDLGPTATGDKNDYYHEIAAKYEIFKKMRKLKRNLAVQGLIYGEKIQGNPRKLCGRYFSVTGVFDIDRQELLPYQEVCALGQALGLSMLPQLYAGRLDLHTFFSLKDFARAADTAGHYHKGVVIMFADESEADKILAIKESLSFRHGPPLRHTA